MKHQGPSRVTLRGHDVDRVIGVRTFVEDAYGLVGKYRFVAGVRDSEETLALVKAGAITGISIGYAVAAGGSTLKDGNRILTDLDLFETSFVTFPMNDLARVVEDSDEKALRAINATLRNLTTASALEAAFANVTNLDSRVSTTSTTRSRRRSIRRARKRRGRPTRRSDRRRF